MKGYSPDLLKTKQLWQQKATIVRNWQVYNKLAYKKVLIAEIGAQSKGQGVVYRVPFNWKVKAPINYWEQVKMYEGILNAFMPKPWCLGVIMWNWELQPWAGTSWPLNGGYTPQNKPALNVMKRFFFRKYYV